MVHLNYKYVFVKYFTVIFVLVSQCAQADTATEMNAIIYKMILTAQTTQKLIKEIALNEPDEDKKFDKLKELANNYNLSLHSLSKEMAEHGEKGKNHVDSKEGSQLMEALNIEMQRTKKELLSAIGSVEEFDAGKFVIPSDRILEVKFEFMLNYFTGATSKKKNIREQIRKNREDLKRNYFLSLSGDKDAINGFNKAFDLVLKMYPKDHPVAQYNLGIVNYELGDKNSAIYWLEKSASSGHGPAITKMRELRNN